MELYHVSPTAGLTVLRPSVTEFFGKPKQVCLTALKPMALLYGVRHFEYTYGYRKDGGLYYQEYFPGALEELAQKLLQNGSADPAAARDELLHTMACKAAIKGGWHSALQELERVARAVMSGQVKYCPHCRPVAIELSKRELEKQFKRA